MNMFEAPSLLLCSTNEAPGLHHMLELLWPFDQRQVYLGFEVGGILRLTVFQPEGQEAGLEAINSFSVEPTKSTSRHNPQLSLSLLHLAPMNKFTYS